MTLLPFIFLLCVLISKLIRKMEELNCQDLEMGISRSSRKMEEDDQTSKTMETTIEAPTHASEDAFADAWEFGSGLFGCSHYRRRCRIRAPCCNEIFDCVHCHNEAKNSVETSSHDQHNIPSHEVIKVICTLCDTEQDVQQNCVSCGVCMGKYFCAKCIFFDDDVSKNQYHCNESGICRDRGRENYFHCKKCGSCYPKLMEDAHQAMHQDWSLTAFIAGVQEMALDEENETITVKGTMDAKVLLEKLKVLILSLEKEKYSNGGDKDSGTGNDDRKKKKGSAQENGNRDTEMKGSLLELKPIEAPAIMAVFKVPLHCDGCIRRIRKIISKIRGVQEVRINKEEETVTVKATIDVNILTETMKKRLKKLVAERKIKIQKEAELVVKSTSQYSFQKQDHKQEIVPSTALQLAEQQEIIKTISVQDSNDGGDQNQSLVSSPDAHTTTETAEWAFLLASLFLEAVLAFLDQRGYLKASMVLSFVVLLLCTIDLFLSARREGLIKMERRGCSPCFCSHSTNGSPTSERFIVVQIFGFTSAVWQCLSSTVKYISALRHSDNPIKMTLLPLIFLLCVLISKLIRKMEELNCQDLEMGISGSSRKMEENDQTSKTMETTIEAPTHASENAFADAWEFVSGLFGCLHYRRRCRIRAPCCNEIFDCVHCHNEAKNSVETSSHDQHNIPSHEVIKVICTLCDTEQDVQQNCVSCGVCMGKYFCAKCIFFDDDVSKNQYHCNGCGICRGRGRENYSHCKKCGSCYPKLMEDAHQAMHQD